MAESFSLLEERGLFDAGYGLIGSVDEAGRGPLAGPVVAACVLISAGSLDKPEIKDLLSSVKDSKKLSPAKRKELFPLIVEAFDGYGIGISDHATIDRINILEASFLAMKKAIGILRKKPDCLIIDGKLAIPSISIPQKPIIAGDNLVFSIAAASILAKVARDNLMLEIHEKYPQYNFAKHKGYGTKEHLEMLAKYGPSPVHRKSFKPIRH